MKTSILTPAELRFLSLGTQAPEPQALTGAYLPTPTPTPAARRPTSPQEHRAQLARLREQAYERAVTAGGPHQERSRTVAAQNLAASLHAEIAEMLGLLR